MQLPLWPRRSCLSLYVVLLAAVFLAPHSVHAAKAKKGGKSSKGKSGGSAGTTMAGSAGGAVGGVCDVPAGSSVEELLRAGSAAFGRDYAASENCYRLVLEKDRKNVLAVYNIGLGQMNQGRPEEAIASFEKAIKLEPSYGEAHFGLGSSFYDLAQRAGGKRSLLTQAETALKKAVKLAPNLFPAHNALGNVYIALQDAEKAQLAYERVVEINPAAPEGHANLGRVLLARGNAGAAAKSIGKGVAVAPTNPHLHHELGIALKAAGKDRDAKRCFLTAVRLQPDMAQSFYQLGEILAGNIFTEDKDIPRALTMYERAIRTDPSLAEAYMSLGMLHWGQGRLELARTLLTKGLKVRPFAEGAANLGIVLSDLGRYEEAIGAYQQAMELNPRLAEAPKCLGDTYKSLNRYTEAIKMYKKALAIRPEYYEALNDLIHALQHTCAWDEWERRLKVLSGALSQELATGGQPLFVKPFHALVYPLNVQHMLLVAQSYAARATRLVRSFHPTPLPTVSALASKNRLRVGWVSSNIGDHSLSHLMKSVFSMHGKNIEGWVFALNGEHDPGDPAYRQQIKTALGTKFVDISRVSGVQGAHIVNRNKIHVLIDLVGYTGGGERANEVFASRPARLQTSYMGFCASTGAPYMQHMVVDRVVAPPEYRSHFSEHLMVVPNSYFVNDHRQQPAWQDVNSKQLARASYKELPAKGTLLACFNQLYKIDPPIFKVWVGILDKFPTAFLWLLKFPSVAVPQIRKEAEKQGLAEDRIRFGTTLPKKEYLERGALADLFLDTPLVNAHTSATDILWAGVPMITTGKESMISRVAASLCLAAGRSEMVAVNLAEYAAVVGQLLQGAGNGGPSPRLQRLKRLTRHSKEHSPLFDTRLWTEHLDVSIRLAWESQLEVDRRKKGQDKGRAPSGYHVIVRPRR